MLNSKDEEIADLSQQVMGLEDEVRRLNGGSPPRSKRGANKLSPKGGKQGIVSGYGAVTDLENKLFDME